MKILSKIILLYTIQKTKFYLFVRKKFPNYFENKELKYLYKFCPDMKQIVNEMNKFYKKVSSFNISYIEKEEKNLIDNINYTYGEINWDTAIKVLEEFDIKANDVFCDLGCGTGKIVFLANKKYKIKSAGIDIISNFIRISNIIKKNLNLQNIYFKNNDFFQENIKQYNLFFITATCFDDKTFNRLIDKLEQIKNNSKIAIVTKKVNKKNFKLYKIIKGYFSWGIDYIYFYKCEIN